MQWTIAATGGALGLVFGSFLNVVIHRGPALWDLVDDDQRRGNLAFPSSYCPACNAHIAPFHLIPLISYVLLRGKCAKCASPISIRYPIVELGGLATGLTAVLLFGATWSAGLAAIFFLTLIALAAIDWETGYLPDTLTLPLIAVGLAANIDGRFTSLTDAVIGAVAGYLVFWGVAVGFEKLRNKPGLGLGDAKLLAAIGAWTGWMALSPTVLVAAVTSLVGVLVASLRGTVVTKETPIPFGPALAAAGAAIFVLSRIYDFA